MSRFRGPWILTKWSVLPFLLLGASCSRPLEVQSNDGAAADQHPVPFHDATAPGNSQPSGSASAQIDHTKPDGDLPFRESRSLPAGTLLTVRLRSAVPADNTGPSVTFEGVVDQPVVIEGNALVPRGAGVEGRVESSRISNVKHNRGYVRLTLDSIDMGGKDFPIQTSSLFARGTAADNAASTIVITLEKGRRLTFRLSEPVYVAGQSAVSGH